ncbi:unnamed protein product [Medioppia subpectinata]|uniref:Cytochrome c oxidase polypeptide VIIc n=1 Tax=Medioppia subpectinata TaxID=1979941 RepID=A0A7R9KW82_9ACAR|nr:unnamed protein product [Medioppia subpectinata]CAG2110645.1 unnamed protein product [Medioppia subpectinata]
MSSTLFTRLNAMRSLARRQTLQSVRRSHDEITYKGQNLPFDISNHRLFAIKFTLFMAVPFAVPFIIVRYQLKKASGQYA